jgi:hypothetical protein
MQEVFEMQSSYRVVDDRRELTENIRVFDDF